MNREKILVTAMAAGLAWSDWYLHVKLSPFVPGTASWAVAAGLLAAAIAVCYALMLALFGGNWRPRT